MTESSSNTNSQRSHLVTGWGREGVARAECTLKDNRHLPLTSPVPSSCRRFESGSDGANQSTLCVPRLLTAWAARTSGTLPGNTRLARLHVGRPGSERGGCLRYPPLPPP